MFDSISASIGDKPNADSMNQQRRFYDAAEMFRVCFILVGFSMMRF